MATSLNQNMTMWQGDDRDIVATISDSAGSAVNITGVTATYSLGTAVDQTATFTKTVGSGIVLTTPASGIMTISIDPADTATLAGCYYHELVITDASGNVNTAFIGEVTINERTA